MKLKSLVLFVFLLCLPLSALAEDRLLFAIDIVRHGDRNSSEVPESPKWPREPYALTDLGIAQERQLGEALRKEYVEKYGLLPEHYQDGILFVRSTETKRTQKSAKALLEGLYPAAFRGGAEIPIQVVNKKEDNLLLVQTDDSILSWIKLRYWKWNFWRKTAADIQDKLPLWRKATGLSLENIDQLEDLADTLYVRQLRDISPPQGIDRKDSEKIISMGEAFYVAFFQLPEVSRPTGLRLVSSIKNYFTNVVQDKSKLKYVLFSGHDATIMSALNIMGVPFSQIPGYASRLNFSLFHGEKGHFIRVTLNGEGVRIPRCGGDQCSIEEFSGVASK